jgi:hypothetical protein
VDCPSGTLPVAHHACEQCCRYIIPPEIYLLSVTFVLGFLFSLSMSSDIAKAD